MYCAKIRHKNVYCTCERVMGVNHNKSFISTASMDSTFYLFRFNLEFLNKRKHKLYCLIWYDMYSYIHLVISRYKQVYNVDMSSRHYTVIRACWILVLITHIKLWWLLNGFFFKLGHEFYGILILLNSQNRPS